MACGVHLRVCVCKGTCIFMYFSCAETYCLSPIVVSTHLQFFSALCFRMNSVLIHNPRFHENTLKVGLSLVPDTNHQECHYCYFIVDQIKIALPGICFTDLILFSFIAVFIIHLFACVYKLIPLFGKGLFKNVCL